MRKASPYSGFMVNALYLVLCLQVFQILFEKKRYCNTHTYMTMVWSPLHAMQAYMHTIQLCKDYYHCNQEDDNSSVLLEPKSMEFISALAAGNQAQLMADISSVAISPSTLALAVAAKQTGGLLLCIRPSPQTLQQTKTHLQNLHLFDVVDLKHGNPCEIIKQYHNIDFAVINNDDHHHHRQGCALSLLLLGLELSMNPNGSSVVVVMNNGEKRSSSSSSCGHEVVRGLRGRGVHVESMILPIGDHGMEVIKINGKGNKHHHHHQHHHQQQHHHHHQEVGRRSKRVFKVFDD